MTGNPLRPSPILSATTPRSKSIRKIMLVEDEDDICTIVKLSLSELRGWEVVMAHSGEDAFHMAAVEQPDAILVDVMLPGIDGVTTAMNLRAQKVTAATPIIFMTAKVQKHEVAQYLELGAAGVITKPFDPMTLPDEISRLVTSPSHFHLKRNRDQTPR